MYKEEKIINGILHYRTSPNAEFKPYTLENLTGIVGMLKEEMQKQQEVNIEGKDPITIEGKDPLTIDFTNPKGGAIPKIGTKEFNDSIMEMFGGKPKQQTAVEWLVEELEMIENTYHSDSTDYIDSRKNAIELAKYMEKQQQDEFAIGFADWVRVCKLKQRPYDFDNIKELLEIYKDEKGL